MSPILPDLSGRDPSVVSFDGHPTHDAPGAKKYTTAENNWRASRALLKTQKVVLEGTGKDKLEFKALVLPVQGGPVRSEVVDLSHSSNNNNNNNNRTHHHRQNNQPATGRYLWTQEYSAEKRAQDPWLLLEARVDDVTGREEVVFQTVSDFERLRRLPPAQKEVIQAVVPGHIKVQVGRPSDKVIKKAKNTRTQRFGPCGPQHTIFLEHVMGDQEEETPFSDTEE